MGFIEIQEDNFKLLLRNQTQCVRISAAQYSQPEIRQYGRERFDRLVILGNQKYAEGHSVLTAVYGQRGAAPRTTGFAGAAGLDEGAAAALAIG